MNSKIKYDLDVIQISDFRLPGGTTSSIAEEVKAQSAAGISTGLLHVAGSVTNYPIAWSSHIQSILELPHVEMLTPYSSVHARLIVFRHPTVALSMRVALSGITADHVVVVANHAAVDAAGKQHYNIEEADAKVKATFGVQPVWAPIGPVVRETMLEQTREVPFREQDWSNVFQVSPNDRPRTAFVGDRPVIGRHSRPQRGKWPSTADNIIDAYPNSDEYRVRILGGSSVAEKILGYTPEKWEVIPFGGMDPREFLLGIDFWVYMHHPDLKEAFGRAAMEALAAGCVAIMPPYMSQLFGDAALYAEPHEVRNLIDSYYGDPARYLEQSRRAQVFAQSFSPSTHLARLEALGVTKSAVAPLSRVPPTERGTAIASSVGPEIARISVIQVARRDELDTAIEVIEDLPSSRSIIVVIADKLDLSCLSYNVVAVPGPTRLNIDLQSWESYLSDRLSVILNAFKFTHIDFIGEIPPTALTRGLGHVSATKTWFRVSVRESDENAVLEKGQEQLLAEQYFQKVQEVFLGSSIEPEQLTSKD